jgi:hypothetical protein
MRSEQLSDRSSTGHRVGQDSSARHSSCCGLLRSPRLRSLHRPQRQGRCRHRHRARRGHGPMPPLRRPSAAQRIRDGFGRALLLRGTRKLERTPLNGMLRKRALWIS